MQKEFPFENLSVRDVFYEFTDEIENEQDAEIEIIIEFEPIKILEEEIELRLEFIGFSNEDLKASVFLEGYNFTEDDELEPASVYLQSVHNPIDLKKLKIEKKENLEIIEMELFFDFEYGQTDFKSHLHKIKFEKRK